MKHTSALGRNGIEYCPQDIRNRSKLVDMRYYGLTTNDTQFELVAVNPHELSKEPYFRFKTSPGKNLTRNENNPSHTEMRRILKNHLMNVKSLRLYTFIDFQEGGKDEVALVYNIPSIHNNFSWFEESYCQLDRNHFSYWDILGRDTTIGNPPPSRPNIVIEVIQSSFPSQETFRFMCEISESRNHIFILFFIDNKVDKRKNYNFYWNNLIKNEDHLDIRCTFYIMDGYLYKNGTQIAYLGWDKEIDGHYFRPVLNYVEESNRYWKKHWLYIRDQYFKKAIYKLNK